MAALDLFGPPGKDAKGRPQGTSRLVNVYRVPGERSPAICRPVPGMTRVASLRGSLMRAMLPVRGRLVAAHGGALWRLGPDGAPARLRTIPDAPDTTLATMDGAVLAVAGGAYRVYTAGGSEADPDAQGEVDNAIVFDGVGSVTVVAQRAVLTERFGRTVQWSAPANPLSFDPLDFATAEQRDEPIIRAAAVGPELWLFKGTHFERWSPTGDVRGFAYLPGSLTELGLMSFNLLAETPRGAFLVGADGRAYLAGTEGTQALSDGTVESHIADAPPHAVLFTRYEARDVCALVWADRPAWVCDLATGEWHERAQGGTDGPWRAVAAAEAEGVRYVGDDRGRVYALGPTVEDDGEPLHRLMVSRALRNENRPFRVARFEALAHTGSGNVDGAVAFRAGLALDFNADGNPDGALALGDDAGLLADASAGREPGVSLRVSRDDGATWSDPKPRSLGNLGERETRLVWRALGRFRSFTAELRCAEPLDVAIDATAFIDLA